MFELTNKTAIVTGSTSGIGKATAIALAAQGANVVVSGRRQPEGQLVVDQINADGGNAIFIAADVTKPVDVANLFEKAKTKFGSIDIAFLNSGIFQFSPLAEQTPESLRQQLDVNVHGVYYGIQEAAKHIPEGGAVIVNSSVVADIGMTGSSAYSLTKGAVNTLVRAAAVELAEQKIRVNAVAPGPIWTEGAEQLFGSRENADTTVGAIPVMKRLGTPEEIAAGVVFLASDEASFITGQILIIDGGSAIH